MLFRQVICRFLCIYFITHEKLSKGLIKFKELDFMSPRQSYVDLVSYRVKQIKEMLIKVSCKVLRRL